MPAGSIAADALLNATPDAIFAIAPDGHILSWNPGAERMFGITPQEALGQDVASLLHPADHAEETRRWLRAALQADRVVYETVCLHKDQTPIHVDATVQAVRDEAGVVQYLTIVKKDVSELKYRRMAAVVHERYGALLEAAPDAMVIVDRSGRIAAANLQVERLFGYPRIELLGKPVEVLVPERFRARHPGHRAHYFSSPRTRGMGSGLELFALRRNGSEFSVEISLSPLQTEEGTLVTAAIRDITERKRVEAKFRGLLEAAPDAMVIVDREGRIALVNQQTERMFGYSRAELLGKPVEILVPEREQARHPSYRHRYFADPRTRPMGAGLDLYARRKDGVEIPVEISLSPLDTEEGTLVSAAIRDITERKEQYRRVQEANRLKSEFLANMSHELRTPLNGIIGFSELLHDGKVGDLLPDQKEYLGDILTSARHLLRLINDVLDLSKVEAGKMELRPEPLQLTTVLGEVRDIVRTLAAHKRIKLELEVAPAVEAVTADAAKLKQVLYNYVSNAIKFTPEGGRVRVAALAEGDDRYRIEVEDNGIGIRTEDLPRLFVEFQQLDASTAKRYSGTGLGLALTRRIVELQGGQVGVRSVYGEGSVFWAVLPKHLPASTEPGPQLPRPRPMPEGTPRVLVVEDEVEDQAWLTEVLTGAGYLVEVVESGQQAIERARTTRYDAITLDLLLSDMNGRDVLRAVRAGELNADTPVIIVSVVPGLARSVGYWVADILAKPIDAAALADAVAQAVGGKKGCRILVVDDDPTDRKLAEKVLALHGHQVRASGDAASALEMARAEPPALVVLDLLMPGMDGLEFLHRFRALPGMHDVPVVVWTGKALTPDDRRALRLDLATVVSKEQGTPALLEELAAQLHRPTGEK